MQILLIAWMTLIVAEHGRGAGTFWVTRRRTRLRLRVFAALYAAAMAVRLIVTLALPPHTLVERGLIPILAHWALAGFIALVSYAPAHAGGRELRARAHAAGAPG